MPGYDSLLTIAQIEQVCVVMGELCDMFVQILHTTRPAR